MMPELLAGPIPVAGTLPSAGAAGASFIEIMAYVGGALSIVGIAAGTLIKIFGKGKNSSAPSPVSATQPAPQVDPVLHEQVRQLGDDIREVKASTMDLRDSHVNISRDIGKIEGKLDIIIALLRPSGGKAA